MAIPKRREEPSEILARHLEQAAAEIRRLIRDERTESADPNCGVYVLYRNNVVIYVGQSIDVDKRLDDHYHARRRWDREAIHACDLEDLDQIEAALIHFYEPSENRRIPSRPKYYETIVRRLGLGEGKGDS